MHAFILAGGFATRLWPLTEKRAKPLLPLAGKPILTRLVEKIPADIPVTVSTNAAFKDAFEEWQHAMGRHNLKILIEDAHKDDIKLGALGATAQWIAQAHIDDDVLLLTGDNYLGFSMERFLAAFDGTTPLLAAFDMKELEKAKAFGTVIAEKNVVTRFEEKPKTPASTLVSTGCSVLPRSILGVLTEFAKEHPDNVGGIFEELLRRSVSVSCFTFTEPWLDIGSFNSYLDAHRMLVGEHIIAGSSAATDESALEGSITIGDHSTIKKCTLHDCMVFDRCQITDCVLRDCIVDDDCILDGVDLHGKMLRTGTVLRAKKQKPL